MRTAARAALAGHGVGPADQPDPHHAQARGAAAHADAVDEPDDDVRSARNDDTAPGNDVRDAAAANGGHDVWDAAAAKPGACPRSFDHEHVPALGQLASGDPRQAECVPHCAQP